MSLPPPADNLPYFIRRPAVPAAAALMLGIFCSQQLPPAPRLIASILLISWTATLLLRRRPMLCTAMLLGSLTIAGIACGQIEAFCYPVADIAGYATDTPRLAELEVRLDDSPRVLTASFNSQTRTLPPRQVVTARVLRVRTWTGWTPSRGSILVQISQPHPRLQQGQTIRVLGTLQRPGPGMNPGQFDWAGYYREQRILTSLQVAAAGNITIMDEAEVAPISYWPLAWLRLETRRLLARGFSSTDQLNHALLAALVLGDNDPELRDVQEQFRRTGTSHHLAISGMHIAVLGGVIYLLCRLLRTGPRIGCWISLIFVVLYGSVALPSPPVIRSVLLCAALAIGILNHKTLDSIQLLAISVIAMLIYHPLDLFNAGFQLSFGTVLGLMLFTRPVLDWLPGRDRDVEIAISMQRPGRFQLAMIQIKHWLRITLATGLIAWVVSMPLIAFHFEQLNPWSILASILLAPTVFASLVGGFAKIILTLLFPTVAWLWAAMAAEPVVWMRYTVDWLAKFPGADVPLPAPPVWMLVLFYALLLSLLIPVAFSWLRWSMRSAAILGCLIIAILPLRGLAEVREHAADLRITFLAIGAGQCCVVEPPGAPAVLIDAGSATLSDVMYKALGPFLRHEGQRTLGPIFISHANYDHFSAVAEATAAYGAGDIYIAPQFRRQSADDPPAVALLRALDAMDHPPREISAGQSVSLGGGATIETVWPPANCAFDANNCSLVLRLNFAGKSVLFTGDIQGPAERALIDQPARIHADVLIAPHHGSYESTTEAFVAATGAKQIVCSNDRTLSVKQKDFDRAMAGRDVYRTNLDGAITLLISPQGEVKIQTFLPPPAH